MQTIDKKIDCIGHVKRADIGKRVARKKLGNLCCST